MFIKRLELKNFKSFSHLEIDFRDINAEKNRNRTIILGGNGTGKSNILKSIALVTAGSNALGELLGNPNDWIRYGEKECRIDLEMTTQKDEQRHIWLEIHKGDTLREVMQRSTDSLDEIDSALSHTDRNYFVVGYGASRFMEGGGRKSRGRSRYYDSQRAQCIASLLDRESSLNSIENWALDLDYRNESSGQEIIRNVFDNFLEGIRFHGIDKKEGRLMLETPDGIVPMDSLSDGYQNMAAWLGDLLFRISDIFSDRKDPLKTAGVLILDEIDLHLHPAWQRKLLQFIEETLPNMQLIASTHSPFVAQQAEAGELFVIKREDGKINMQQYLGNPQNLLLHQLIMSDVFGLETDESVELGQLKQERQRLRQAKTISTSDEQRLKEIEERLSDAPVTSYGNSLLSSDEKEIMLSMLKTYKKGGEHNA